MTRTSRTAPDTDTRWSGEMTARIATGIRELRGDMSAQRVSDRTAELGSRVTRAVIADLETGRRTFLPVHELVMIAAALGVSPATLMTWGSYPDGDVEVLPGRTFPAHEVADWWGGTPLNPFASAARGLPVDTRSTDLVSTTRERERLRDLLVRSRIGGMTSDYDPTLVSRLRDLLDGAVERIRSLGGVLRDKETMGEGDGETTTADR